MEVKTLALFYFLRLYVTRVRESIQESSTILKLGTVLLHTNPCGPNPERHRVTL